jgi:hypothetical protein
MPLGPAARPLRDPPANRRGRNGGSAPRARHLKLHRDVAIKVLPTRLAADSGLLARFEREARASRKGDE